MKEGSLFGDLGKEGHFGDRTVALYIFNVKRGPFQQRPDNDGFEHRGKAACQMTTTTEEDAENECLPPFSVDGDPRYTHAVLTFILLPTSEPQPAEKVHGDDCVGLAEIDRPVSLIVVLRRQNAI